MVKYCNRDCQVAHRQQHKNACKVRAAEIYDEKLFQEPPHGGECPICCHITDGEHDTYMSCCGKNICIGCISGCAQQNVKRIREGKRDHGMCVYCRAPMKTNRPQEVTLRKLNNLMEKGEGQAIDMLAGYYRDGEMGLTQDMRKANELYLKAGEFGYSRGYFNLAQSYLSGSGVEVNMRKARYYWELAAMNGHIHARHNLACEEGKAGNHQRAYRHMVLAARAGSEESLAYVKIGYRDGYVTKDEFADTLRAYQKVRDEIMSDERVKGLALLGNARV